MGKKIPVGQQQAGDVGSTCGPTAHHGYDHIYLVLERQDSDKMVIVDNQNPSLMNDSASGKGKTPTKFFCAVWKQQNKDDPISASRLSLWPGKPSTPAEAQLAAALFQPLPHGTYAIFGGGFLYASFDAQLSGHLLYLARQRAGRATPIYYRDCEKRLFLTSYYRRINPCRLRSHFLIQRLRIIRCDTEHNKRRVGLFG